MSVINNKLIDGIEVIFKERFGLRPDHIARAPGRVNLLGEHVDYNDGVVMPAAIDHATYVAFSPSNDNVFHLVAKDFGEEVAFTSGSIQMRSQVDSTPLTEWGLYPAGVVKVLVDSGYRVQPINAVFASDVPIGAGLSSSASVEVAFLTAWQNLSMLSLPAIQQANLCKQAENAYVGVNCGIMDQFASVCGVENRLLQLDCRSLEWETIEIPKNITIVIADTTIRRKLTTVEYNQRRQDCEEAVRILKVDLPQIRTLRDVSLEEFESCCAKLPTRVEKRARHVVEEIARTNKAKRYLASRDIANFGKLINECHGSLQNLYEVSSFELDTMVEIAQSLEGCYGARLTGAGFGGCTVNLVEIEKTEKFTNLLKEKYQKKTGLIPEIYLTHASNGAELVR